MSIPIPPARFAYALLDLLLRLSPLLPERWHAGKRARRALRHCPEVPVAPWFERRVFASRLRSAFLLRYALSLNGIALRRFLDENVRCIGSSWPLQERKPLILAAPHYGAAAVGFLAAAHRMPNRKINVYYDETRRGPLLTRLFDRSGIETAGLLGGTSGVVGALRALRRGECLIIMPDAFADIARTLVVPFFGRLLRVPAGTAYLALRSRALIVPVFARPDRRLRLCVELDAPIDAGRFAGDDAQRTFMITRALIARFEAAFRTEPAHWHGWENLHRFSTAVDPAHRVDLDEPLRLLRAKCESVPDLLQEIPELAMLLE